MPSGDPAGQSPQLAALAGRLAELQKAARDASETTRSGIARFDSELSAIRTEAGRLAQRLDGLKGEVEERLKGAAKAADVGPLTTKLAALERELQTFLDGEADRDANASRIVLTLELANLKRAIDRGERYADELARAKKVGGALNFTALERYMLEGVPAPAELAKSFPKAANAMLDAEAERGRCHPRRPAAGGRALDRARAQGRPRRRRHQRRGRRRPHGGRAQGRPPRRGAGQRQEAAAQGCPCRRGLGQEGRGAPGRRAGAGRRRGGAESLARARARPPARTDGDDPHPPLSDRGAGDRRRPRLARRSARHDRRRVAGLRRRDQRVPRLHPAAADGGACSCSRGRPCAGCGRARRRSAASSTGGGEKRGLDALSSGIIAIGAGDRALAARYAGQARKALAATSR